MLSYVAFLGKLGNSNIGGRVTISNTKNADIYKQNDFLEKNDCLKKKKKNGANYEAKFQH